MHPALKALLDKTIAISQDSPLLQGIPENDLQDRHRIHSPMDRLARR
jgi:hypothetical protein